jgi:hypothetical protein
MIAASFTTKWINGYRDCIAGMKLVDQYFKENWKRLGSFMIFYVRNMGASHWVLDVAVNSFCMISKISLANLDETNRIYGFLHIDPLEGGLRNGTMPSTLQFSQDSPLHIREIFFAQFYVKVFCDLNIHGLLETFVPQDSTEYFMAMGASVPFGQVFAENNTALASLVWETHSASYFPQLKMQTGALPVQCKGYDCGIYVIYNIMDLVLTQCSHVWYVVNILDPDKPTEYPASFWSAFCRFLNTHG